MLKLNIGYKLLLTLFVILLVTSLWPGNIYILVAFSFLTYIVLPIKKWWDNTAIILAIFSVFYSLNVLAFNEITSGFNLLSYLISPVAFYRFGKFLSAFYYEDKIRERLFFVIISVYLLSLFILTVKDVTIVGVINISRKMLGDSTDNNALSATLYGLMASVGISCIASLFAKKQERLLRLSFIILSLCSLFVVCHLLNRTGIVIFLFTIFLSFVISTKMRIKKVIPAFILIAFLVVLIINSGIISDEFLEAYQQREMSSSSDASNFGGRSDIWKDALQKLCTHPFGWEKVRYAHNLWLDIARVGGWLSLLFFSIASIKWLKSCYLIARQKCTPFRLLLVSMSAAMFLSSFVEPVMDASMLFFSILMILWAFTISLTNKKSMIQ